jgi:sec-independent protein translocase protein TatC
MPDPRDRGYDPDEIDEIPSGGSREDPEEIDTNEGDADEADTDEADADVDVEETDSEEEGAAESDPEAEPAIGPEEEPAIGPEEEPAIGPEEEPEEIRAEDSEAEPPQPSADAGLPRGIEPDPVGEPTPTGSGGGGSGGSGGGGFSGGWGEGPTEDEEMPLAEHVEEMVQRAAIVAFVAAVVAVFVYPFGEELINFLWYSILPGDSVTRPHLYSPLELVLAQIKVASLVGIILALPVLVYQSYVFMRPGLYPHERRYYLAAIPTSLVLAFVGVTFAYFVVLPLVFTYFLHYTEQVTRIAFALGQTFDLILILMGYLAIVFQIPLFVMLALMLNIVTREWLVQRRLLFWGGFVGVAFLFAGVDPTGVSPIIIGVTMILLFEGTLFLAKWTGDRSGETP